VVKFFNTKTSGLGIIKEVVHGLGISAISEAIPAVRNIISDVKKNGDAAIVKYTNQFDHINASGIAELKVTTSEIETAIKSCPQELLQALEFAAKRIEAYHVKQMPVSFDDIDEQGVRLGNIWKPIKVAGLYVPGGTASYPSSVLMNAVPARVAGVKELVMVTPAPGGNLNPAVLAAAKIAGVTEIYKIGGAQAIAALALGGNSVPTVDKIVGPGNAYVAAAKRELSNIVGIDMIAGPSEILVVADNKTYPHWIAADLLSQAEHDENAQSILITDDEAYANAVIDAVEQHLSLISRADIARRSWENKGVVIVDEGFKNLLELINYIAPEHLELAVDNASEVAAQVTNAGAIFLGRYTPEAIGDYTAGPSHVLPTSGTARFASGLSVYDFLKRISLIGCTQEAFTRLAGATATLADSEGLGAHALSIRIRR
jgi:histidinol dehydrogenase